MFILWWLFLGSRLTLKHTMDSSAKCYVPLCVGVYQNKMVRKTIPVEFLRAISSALDVLRWSMRKLGILNGGTCILSDENWCLNGRCRSGDGIDKLSNFNLLRCCRSMWSNISCNVSNKIVNCSKFNCGFTVWGNSDGITLVAIIFTDSPYFLSLSMIRFFLKEQKRQKKKQKEKQTELS